MAGLNTMNRPVFGPTSSIGTNTGAQQQPLSPTQTQATAGGGMSSAMMFAPALTGLLGAWSAGEDIKARNDALIDNIEAKTESIIWSQNNRLQQIKDIDRVYSDKLSASGLQALKDEGRLKAASAETGTIANVGSTSTAIAQADVNRLHRNSAILRAADVKKANALQEMVGERMNFEYTLDVMTSGQQSDTGMWLSSLSNMTNSMMTGLNFMNDSQKEQFFMTDTTGMETT
jgi:hypothetical protein